jgi:hypothetical protein
MTPRQRMSPFTAFFLGLFGLAAVGVASVTAVALRTLSMLDSKASSVLTLAGDAVSDLPSFLNNLPPALADIVNDRRDPGYSNAIDVRVALSPDEARGGVRPSLTVRNGGEDVVSMLAVRVVALDSNGRPVDEWTEVVATPIAIEGEWRGPLLPGKTRHVLLSRGARNIAPTDAAALTGEVEIADLRVWQARSTPAGDLAMNR